MRTLPLVLSLLLAGVWFKAAGGAETLVSPSGNPVALVMFPTGGGNKDISIIHDGIKPDVQVGENVGDSALQYDSYDGENNSPEDWVGYEFDCTFRFTRVVFQEGKSFNNGGWFEPAESLVVQVKDPGTGDWAEAPGSWDPPYPGQFTNGEIVEFETFTWTAAAPVSGNGIRIYGVPGGTAYFISVAELEAYAEDAGTPPEIVLTYDPKHGEAPLDVDFDASASKGDNLVFAWDFGDGETATDAKVTHTYAANGNYPVKLVVSSDASGCTLVSEKRFDFFVGPGLAGMGRPVCSVMAPTGGGNHDINVIRDGVKPDTDIGINTGNSALQYDTYDGPAVVTEEWIGYEWDDPLEFASLVFQEGKHFGNGGYFDPPESLVVQVKDQGTGEWAEVPGSWDPPYQGLMTDGQIIEFETFVWTADEPVTGTGIRIFGQPGGAAAFISCAELEVYTPPGAVVTRTLSKPVFAAHDSVPVSLDILMKTGDSIALDEVVPPGSIASDISDGGVLAGDTIHWDLAGITQKTLTYTLTPPTCAPQPEFGGSHWTSGFSAGGVDGASDLTLDLADHPLGAWTSLDLTAPDSVSQPIGAHEVIVKGTGAGVRFNGVKDGLRFVERAASGDFEVTARIDCIDDPGRKGQAGLMVRDTADDFSANAFFYLSAVSTVPGSAASLGAFYRKATATPPGKSAAVSLSDKDVPALPVFLRLRRGLDTDGKTKVFFERSFDGSAYDVLATKEVGAAVLDLKDDVLVGLAVSGGGGGATTATFAEVSGPEFPVGGTVGPTFRRGDADASGKLDLTDAIFTLGFLFQGGPAPGCMDAADANDDGALDLTDPIFTLGFLFQGGESPPAPGPTNCGPDATAPAKPFPACVYPACP